MNKLFTGQDGALCGAKTAFMSTLIVFMLHNLAYFLASFWGVEVPAPDYAGQAAFLTPLGAVYFGRSHTKSKEKKPYV